MDEAAKWKIIRFLNDEGNHRSDLQDRVRSDGTIVHRPMQLKFGFNGDVYKLDGTPVFTDEDYIRDFGPLDPTASEASEFNYTDAMISLVIVAALLYGLRRVFTWTQSRAANSNQKPGSSWKDNFKRKFKRATKEENKEEEQK